MTWIIKREIQYRYLGRLVCRAPGDTLGPWRERQSDAIRFDNPEIARAVARGVRRAWDENVRIVRLKPKAS